MIKWLHKVNIKSPLSRLDTKGSAKMEKETYTLTDLMERYNKTRQALQQYIVSHLQKLNSDGIEHVKKEKGDWKLDRKAVKKLDEMRGYNDSITLADEVQQKKKEAELLQEISNLKTAMLTIKEEYQREKEELYKQLLAEKDRAHAAELLQLQSRSQLEQLEQAKDIAEQQAAAAQERATASEAATAQERQKAEAAAQAAAKERTAEQTTAAEKLAKVKDKYSKLAEENYKLKAALQEERQKSWFDRLLGR
jgi:hypothetical protein